jgi:hypothetical protein
MRNPNSNPQRKAEIQALLLVPGPVLTEALKAELATMSIRDVMDIAHAVADKFSADCEAYCSNLIEANIPRHKESQAEVQQLMARLKLGVGPASA